MKKLMLMMLIVAMLSVCTACGGEENTGESASSTQNVQVSTDENTENDDSVAVTEDKETADAPSGEITMDDVLNHSETPASDFSYTENADGGLTVERYDGSDAIVVIPESVDGKPVTKIGQYTFANDSCVKGIRLSSSVKVIGKFAFPHNTNLKYVVLSSGVEEIGESAFQECTSLQDVIMGENVKVIDLFSFGGCTSLKSIEVPESVETINGAFCLMSEDFKIIGTAGSVAETYATSNGFTFEAK